MLNKVHCNNIGCDHNTFFTKECMYGVSKELIQDASEGKPMCPVLRREALKYAQSTASSTASSFTFQKTVNVTNVKNVLCQIPRAVVSDWGLKVGDELELTYNKDEITIRPAVRGRSGSAAKGN